MIIESDEALARGNAGLAVPLMRHNFHHPVCRRLDFVRWAAATNALDVDYHIVAVDGLMHLSQLALRGYWVHMVGWDTYTLIAHVEYEHFPSVGKVCGESHFVKLWTDHTLVNRLYMVEAD